MTVALIVFIVVLIVTNAITAFLLVRLGKRFLAVEDAIDDAFSTIDRALKIKHDPRLAMFYDDPRVRAALVAVSEVNDAIVRVEKAFTFGLSDENHDNDK